MLRRRRRRGGRESDSVVQSRRSLAVHRISATDTGRSLTCREFFPYIIDDRRRRLGADSAASERSQSVPFVASLCARTLTLMATQTVASAGCA